MPTSDIYIPTPEEIARVEPYGVLYGDFGELKYVDLDKGEIHTLESEMVGVVHSITATKTDVYYTDTMNQIISLFSNLNVMRDSFVNEVLEHKNNLLDCGSYGLYSRERELISKEEMSERRIQNFNSLTTDRDQNLYALVSFRGNAHGLIALEENGDHYELGRELLYYTNNHKDKCHAEIIPYDSTVMADGRKYDFTVLGCTYQEFLDLNGKRIGGIKMGRHQTLTRIRPIHRFESKIEVLYCGLNMETIKKATIDLQEMKATSDEVLHPEISSLYLGDIEVVHSVCLHKRLLERVNNNDG